MFGAAPDLLIEILSPATREIDRTLKFRQYEKFAVREYWIVDPEARSVEIDVLRESHLEGLLSAEGDRHVRSEILARIDFPASLIFE
jgi:Uma2 family endonuclease